MINDDVTITLRNYNASFDVTYVMHTPKINEDNIIRQAGSALTILFPPLINIVTARVFLHSSMTNMRSLVVPNDNSLTMPAWPNFSDVSSENRGTIRPPVAIAIN